MNRNELREALAAYIHEAWVEQTRFLFRESNHDREFGTVIIPPQAVECLVRQMRTSYADLPEMERQSDQLEADKMLAIMDEYLQSPLSKEETCEWKHDDYGDYWETSCDGAFQLVDGDLEENSMRFCPYCGLKIEQVEKEGKT